MRKLLPYEYDLIDALGVSKEEYLEFLALQVEYQDIKEGTALDIRNDFGITALVLTVVGVLFQLAAALLTPKPKLSSGGDQQPGEAKFAPRFGFNTTQELAKYGDPIPLVYTNKLVNTNGGVRVATSLIWSAVQSFGQNQYVQLLTALAGGSITAVDQDKTAFGQTPISNLVAESKWTYFKPGSTGALQFANETSGNSSNDPAKYGNITDNPYRIRVDSSAARSDGFSQTYSPTTSNSFGGYSPVPFATLSFLRDSKNTKFSRPLDIYLESVGFDYAKTGFSRPFSGAIGNTNLIPLNSTIRLWIFKTEPPADLLTGPNFFNLDIFKAAASRRRTCASVFDDASIFKLGSAVFQVTKITGASIDTEDVFVDFKCIEAGTAPSIPYVPEEKNSSNSAYYYLKALARVESAQYTSISNCNVIDLALKCQIFRRINGRQRVDTFITSDNGFKSRSAMFLLRYRCDGGPWNLVNGIFVVRRSAEQDNYIYIKLIKSVPCNWEIIFEPVIDPVSEIVKEPTLTSSSGLVNYLYIENTGSTVQTPIGDGVNFIFTGFVKQVTRSFGLPPIDDSPIETREWDWFSLDADTELTASFDRGPEFTLLAVTEQQFQAFDLTRLYKNLSLFGFNAFSGKGLRDVNSLTAFVTQGKPVRVIDTTSLTYPSAPTGPTCYAPDIFLDTVIDNQDGIGNYATVQGIDTTELAYAKRFCVANNLFFDGLIVDRTSWRSFWVSNAPYSLLEFARIGGKETLVPSVPYNRTSGAIERTVKITALFNQGNILEDSYKEEFIDYSSNVQDITATVIYRSLDPKGVFAVNRSISIQRADIVENDTVLQTFDLSAYVTNEAQAILFGKLICNTRRYVRSAIEFKTFPTTSPVMPGAYIYVDIGQNQWDGIYTGVVGADGKLNVPVAGSIPNGTYSILLYRSGDGVISTTTTITNNTAANLTSNEGWIFVLGNEVRTKRVYRITDVEMDEEGEVTVRASIYPCDSSDRSLIADFTDSLFTIRR
jgi:hypothetical protein